MFVVTGTRATLRLGIERFWSGWGLGAYPRRYHANPSAQRYPEDPCGLSGSHAGGPQVWGSTSWGHCSGLVTMSLSSCCLSLRFLIQVFFNTVCWFPNLHHTINQWNKKLSKPWWYGDSILNFIYYRIVWRERGIWNKMSLVNSSKSCIRIVASGCALLRSKATPSNRRSYFLEWFTIEIQYEFVLCSGFNLLLLFCMMCFTSCALCLMTSYCELWFSIS